ncbi:MAG: alpha/beta fold hydrolase [Mucilaginibacter sp.]|nr:alpha/beta fold hydrolase [Mucilaginibacter sp.]
MKTYKNTLGKMITGALLLFAASGFAQTTPAADAIRPFHISIPEKNWLT